MGVGKRHNSHTQHRECGPQAADLIAKHTPVWWFMAVSQQLWRSQLEMQTNIESRDSGLATGPSTLTSLPHLREITASYLAPHTICACTSHTVECMNRIT
jgi:hypothetical protein